MSLAVPPPTNGPRSLCARMSRHERPEEWSDIRISDLRGWALENRGRLLGHALTVLKAHAVAGFPTHNLHPFGDYGQWSRVAREAVVTAGLPDPLLSSAGLRATGTRPSRHSRRCSATGTAWTPRTRG